MDPPRHPTTRRRYLVTGAASIMVTGCLGTDNEVDEDTEDTAPPTDDTDDEATPDDTDDTGDENDDINDEPQADETDDEPPTNETDDDSDADPDHEDPAYDVETVIDDLGHPWGLDFLADSTLLLVTEREGRLQLVDYEAQTATEVSGLPDVHVGGQGGLLDVHVDAAVDGHLWVYFTYVASNGDGALSTHVGRGRLDTDETALQDVEAIYAVEPFMASEGHFGSRVVIGPDDRLYVSTGDRQEKDFGPDHISQSTDNGWGCILRLERDGTIPDDNPFIDATDEEPAIFSYGHRNVQGMTIHPENEELWITDHGEQDGDEINVLEAGGNFGWPITHYGCTYSGGEPIGDKPHEVEAVVDPVYYWPCNSGGFPPSGMWFYTGEAFPAWHGDLFVGNLAGRYLGRFVVDGHDVTEVDPLLADRGWRIRAVKAAPESGELYVLVDAAGGPLVRLVPA